MQLKIILRTLICNLQSCAWKYCKFYFRVFAKFLGYFSSVRCSHTSKYNIHYIEKKQSQLYFFTVLLGITPSLFYKISAHILHCHKKNQIAKGTLLQFKIPWNVILYSKHHILILNCYNKVLNWKCQFENLHWQNRN